MYGRQAPKMSRASTVTRGTLELLGPHDGHYWQPSQEHLQNQAPVTLCQHWKRKGLRRNVHNETMNGHTPQKTLLRRNTLQTLRVLIACATKATAKGIKIYSV